VSGPDPAPPPVQHETGCDGQPGCWCQTYIDFGYIWCRPDEEWHRPPECPVNEAGEPDPWWEHLRD
jgi:hypothetical protein